MEFYDGFITSQRNSRASTFVIHVSEARSNWLAIPSTMAMQLLQANCQLPVVFQLHILTPGHGSNSSSLPMYAAWVGDVSSHPGTVELPRALAKCLHLQAGMHVELQVSPPVPIATRVIVEPASVDDWELVECNASLLEERLLTQAAVVTQGAELAFWVSPQAPVYLRVSECQPASTARLAPGVEVAVAPRPRALSEQLPKQLSTSAGTTVSRDEHSQQERLMGHRRNGSGGQDGRGMATIPGNAVDSAKVQRPGEWTSVPGEELSGSTWGAQNGRTASGRAVWLRLQALSLVQPHPVPGEKAAHAAQGSKPWVQLTCWAWVHPDTLASASWADGMTVHLRAHSSVNGGGRVLLGQSTSVAYGHVAIHPFLALQWGMQPYTMVHAQPKRTPQVPSEVPLQGPPHGPSTAGPQGLPPTPAAYSNVHQLRVQALRGMTGRTTQPLDEAAARHIVQQWLLVQAEHAAGCIDAADSGSQELRSNSAQQWVAVPLNAVNVAPAAGEAASGADQLRQSHLEHATGDLSYDLLVVEPVTEQGLVPPGSAAWLHLALPLSQAGLQAVVAHWSIQVCAPRQLTAGLLATSTEPAVEPSRDSEMLLPGAAALLHRLRVRLAWDQRRKVQCASVPALGGMLVCGSSGSGKTRLTAWLCAQLASRTDCLAYCHTLDCRDLAGDADKPGSASKSVAEAVGACLTQMPSLLVLDNMDMLLPASGDESAPPQGPVVEAPALTATLCMIMDEIRLLDLPDATRLPSCMRNPGRFEHTLELPDPGVTARTSILVNALSQQQACSTGQTIHDVAAATDGHTAADLAALAKRAVHAAGSRLMRAAPDRSPSTHADFSDLQPDANKGDQSAGDAQVSTLGSSVAVPVGAAGKLHGPEPQLLTVTAADWAAARSGFVPASLWGVRAGAQGERGPQGWQDVGGLSTVRSVLQESLELPTKYAALTAKSPIRLRTGVLLYGPPGCGKTHIVQAAVAATGVRLVSVKGPEVLNKYIGASEAAVRELFRKAQAAAPCCLFFDEFDSIAPQRGHDNTGVSDRVVNQLLTELDGVEGLRGVSVVAATSRPDLIDAALLRPGRLDRLVFCGVPSDEERLDILMALSRTMNLAGDVSFQGIAAATAGFSGADLSALLSEAQLAAVHEALDAVKSEPPTQQLQTQVCISGRHLQSSLMKSAPSIHAGERRRLDAIYERFTASRAFTPSRSTDKGKRATLA